MVEQIETKQLSTDQKLAGNDYRALGDAYLRDLVFNRRPKTVENLERDLDFGLFGGCFVFWQIDKGGIENPSQNTEVVRNCAEYFQIDLETSKNYLLFAEKIHATKEGGE